MRLHGYAIVLLLISSLVGCGTADNSATLRLNLADTSSFRFGITNIQDTHMTIMNQDQQTTSESYTEVRYDIVEVADDGSVKINIIYETVVVTQTDQFGDEQIFDSRTDDLSALGPNAGVGTLVGKSITMVLDAQGNVVEIYGLAEIMEQSMDDPTFGMGMDGEENAEFRRYFADQLEESIRTSASPSQGVTYPQEPVEIGSVWTASQTMTITFFALQLDNSFEVVALDDTSVSVALQGTGDISTASTEAFMQALGAQAEEMDLSISGAITQTGDMVIDRQTGLVLQGSSESSTNADMVMEMMGVSMTMPMTTSTKTIIQTLP